MLGTELTEVYLLDSFLTEEKKNRQYLCLILLFCGLYSVGKIINTNDKGNTCPDWSSS
jgi:hypothetical protein